MRVPMLLSHELARPHHEFNIPVVARHHHVVSISWSFYAQLWMAALYPPARASSPSNHRTVEQTERMLNEVLVSPLTRASPTIVGFLFGVCMWNEDGMLYKDIFGKARTVSFMFSVSCPFATSSVGHPVFLAFYAAFHRPLWAISLLSFLYLSHHGSFSWIHAILTWRIFSPLSKLTWIALVFTEPIILYFFSSLYRPSYATNWSTVSVL
ncbi:hypothetical protein COOONC_04643 [Cooperia oncophora]